MQNCFTRTKVKQLTKSSLSIISLSFQCLWYLHGRCSGPQVLCRITLLGRCKSYIGSLCWSSLQWKFVFVFLSQGPKLWWDKVQRLLVWGVDLSLHIPSRLQCPQCILWTQHSSLPLFNLGGHFYDLCNTDLAFSFNSNRSSNILVSVPFWIRNDPFWNFWKG